MFKTSYIYELISGQLSIEGYKHFINTITLFVRKYNWPKSIIVSSYDSTNKFWSPEEINELAHQFFERSISKGKFKNLSKIPESYLSYYFSQILVSFIANRIKEEQQKEGLSYDKCRELVISLCKEYYFVKTIEGSEYTYGVSFSKEDVKTSEDVSDVLSYLSKIPIKENIKHFRPLVKQAIEAVHNTIASPILLGELTKTVFSLFDQKSLINMASEDELLNEDDIEILNKKFDDIIKNIVSELSKDEAKMISHFLFNNEKKQSLDEIANIYNIPKSTLHYKVDSFKKKISKNYTPESEVDGLYFIKNISKTLDNISN